jgi:hypothetical protein
LATASGPLRRRRARRRFSQRIGFLFIAGGPDDDYELVSATSQIYV